jgi:hypothetical protein
LPAHDAPRGHGAFGHLIRTNKQSIRTAHNVASATLTGDKHTHTHTHTYSTVQKYGGLQPSKVSTSSPASLLNNKEQSATASLETQAIGNLSEQVEAARPSSSPQKLCRVHANWKETRRGVCVVRGGVLPVINVRPENLHIMLDNSTRTGKTDAGISIGIGKPFRCQHLPARIDSRIQRVRKFVAFAEWQAGRQAGMHACMHARMHAGRHACLLRGCPVAHHHHHHLRHANADLE